MMGIGPAFYTKLIFFLKTKLVRSWIAGLRVRQILLNAAVVKLNSNKYVVNQNSTQVYSKYLEFISELKTILSIESVSKTEELIFLQSYPGNSHK